jgi:hypothetical protein
MKDIMPDKIKFNFEGKTYNLQMSMYIMREIQKHFNCSIFELSEIIKLESSGLLEDIGYLITLFLNEAIIEEGGKILTQDYVERHLPPSGYNKCIGTIVNAIQSAFPRNEEETEGNAESLSQ